MTINPRRSQWLHWTANTTCYILLLMAIAFGIGLMA
jgi:hypothetical protein